MSLFARAFAYVATFFKKHRKIILPVFAVAFFGVIAIAHESYAAVSVNDVTGWDALKNPVDTIMVLIAALFNSIASGVGWMIITLIKVILIPILNYDGFSTSRIIGLGWSLVRDVVNMFVVIILLVIAVLTIVGSPKANWEQQIPRLFIYVIAVNFSRTICGLLLDVGNVIMFQFVNAILDVGAGNFAQLLHLNVSGSFSDLNGEATKAFQLLASAYLQLALLLAILVVIGIMVLVFLYRIVILWVLIIMSPAAFFLGGIKDVLGQAGSAYSEWWKKFSSAIILGPMLTFFLWLALAAASTGDIVQSENFPVGEKETTTGLLLKAFDMSQITGLLLGLVLLVVGMQQAAGAAGALGGVAAQFINEGMGMRIAKGAIRLPAREIGRQVERRTGITGKAGGALLGVGAALAPIPIVGRGLRNAGGALQKFSHDGKHDAEHAAQERVKGWSNDRLATELQLMQEGNGSMLMSNRDDNNFAMKRLVTDKDLQDEMEGKLMLKHGADEGGKKFQDMMRSAIGTVEKHEADIIGDDDAAGKSFNKTKTRFVHLLGAMTGPDGKEKTAAERQRGHLDSDKTDLRDLSSAAIKDEGVRANLATLEREEDGKKISKLDDIRAGKAGDKLKKAALEAPNDRLGNGHVNFAPGPVRGKRLTEDSVDQLKVAVAGGDLRISGTQGIEVTNFHGVDAAGKPIGEKLAKAVAISGSDFTLASNQFNDSATSNEFKKMIELVIHDTDTSVADKRKAIAAQFLLTKDSTGAYEKRNLTFSGPHKGDQIAALGEILKADPALAKEFTPNTTEIQDAVERAVSESMITNLRMEAGKLKKTDQRYKDIAAALTNMKTAVDAIQGRASSGMPTPEGFKRKHRMITAAVDEI